MTVENESVVVFIPVGIVPVDFHDFGNKAPAGAAFQVDDDVYGIADIGFDRAGKVFHAIRHTTGSVMLESGASIINVQRQLRHTSATTTLNIYGHVLGDSQRRAVDKLAQVLMS